MPPHIMFIYRKSRQFIRVQLSCVMLRSTDPCHTHSTPYPEQRNAPTAYMQCIVHAHTTLILNAMLPFLLLLWTVTFLPAADQPDFQVPAKQAAHLGVALRAARHTHRGPHHWI
jgi:hypothetical protein